MRLFFSYALTANQQKYSCPRTFENIYQLKNMAGKIKVPDDCSYKTFSVCESVVDSSSRVEEDGENDGPAVFMCGKCKLTIGDSLTWAGSDDEQNQIMLKRKRLLRFYCCCL